MDNKNNTGNSNTGYSNTGDWNTGYSNTGNRNTGDWNTGDRNTGYFNTIIPETILVFNKECNREEWDNANKPSFIYFNLTEWISTENMTEEEKEEHQEYQACGGYFKKYEYKEAFQKSFNELSKEEKKEQIEQLKSLPNFDKAIFYEISGIDIENYDVAEEMTLEQISKELGRNIKIVKEDK